MLTWTLFLLFLFVTAASFTQRVTGFGFGIIAMTMLPYLLPSYGEATALSGLLAIFTALIPAIRMRGLLHWRKLVVILPVFLAVSFFAVRMVTGVDSDLLRHILGGVLIAVSLYFFFISGRIHLPGCADSKDEYIALTQWYFLIGNAAMSLFRAGNGLVTPTVLRMWCFALPGVFLGLWLGKKVYARLRAERLRKVVYAFLAVAGFAALLA